MGKLCPTSLRQSPVPATNQRWRIMSMISIEDHNEIIAKLKAENERLKAGDAAREVVK